MLSRSTQEVPDSSGLGPTRPPHSPHAAPMAPTISFISHPPRTYTDSTLGFRLSVMATIEVWQPPSQQLDTAQLLLLRGNGFHISATLSHVTSNSVVSLECLGRILAQVPVPIPIPGLLSAPLIRAPDVGTARPDPRAFHLQPYPSSAFGNPPSALARNRKLG